MDTGGSEGVRQVRLTVREAVAQVHNSGAFEEMKVKLINEMRVDRNEEDIQRKAKRIARQTNLVQRIYEDQRTLHSNPATIFQALHRELTRQLMNDIELGQFIDTAIDRFLFPTPGYRFHNNRSMDQSIKKSVESSLALLAPGAKQNPKAKNEIAPPPAKDETSISKRTILPVKSESKDTLYSLVGKRSEETKQETDRKDELIPPGLDKSLLLKEIGTSEQQTGTSPTRTDTEQTVSKGGESEQARAGMVQSEVKVVEKNNEEGPESSTQAPSTEKEKSGSGEETKISHEDLQSLFDELNGSSGDEIPTYSKPEPIAQATDETIEDESSSESDDELLLSPESEEEPSEPEKQKKNSRSSRLATVGSKRSTIPRKAKQKAKETAKSHGTTSRRKRRRVR